MPAALAHLKLFEQNAPPALVKETLEDITPFLYSLGISLYRDNGTRDNVDADSCMHKILEINPENCDALYSLGFALLDSKLEDKGLPMLEKCVSKDADYWQAHMRLANFYKEKKKSKLAMKHFKEVVRICPEEPYLSGALNELGNLYMEEDDMDNCESIFSQSLELNPEQPLIKANLANVLSNKGEYQKALDLLLEISGSLHRASISMAIAVLSAKLEKFDLVKKQMEEGILGSKHTYGIEEFVRILASCRIVDEGNETGAALECFQMCDKLMHDLPELNPSVKTFFLFKYGKLLERSGREEEARDAYLRCDDVDDVPENDPLPSLAKYTAAQMSINKMENVDEGLRMLEELLERVEDNEQADFKKVTIENSLDLAESQNFVGLLHEKIGTANSLKGNHEVAIENYKKALELNKKSVLVMANMANSLLALERTDEAIELLQKGLVVTALFAPLHTGLCVAFARKKDWERVIHHAQLSVGLDKEFQPRTCYNHMAVAYRETGNQQEAEKYLKMAQEVTSK